MIPTPQEKAKQLYNDAYMRWSYEPSYDKNYLMAKAIADFVCDEVLGYMGADRGHQYWTEVKEHIQKL